MSLAIANNVFGKKGFMEKFKNQLLNFKIPLDNSLITKFVHPRAIVEAQQSAGT